MERKVKTMPELVMHKNRMQHVATRSVCLTTIKITAKRSCEEPFVV